MKSIYSLVGMKYQNTEALVASLPKGEAVTLVREPSNVHDSNAVQAWARGTMLGYILAAQARSLARRMDQDTPGQAVVGRMTFDGGARPMVEIDQ